MKIPKSILIDPDNNRAYAAFAVAVSVFAFAYSTNFGQILILAYCLVWLPLLFVDYRRFARTASLLLVNDTISPSPRFFTSVPRWAVTSARRASNTSWRRASAAASPRPDASAVDSTRSQNRRVTVAVSGSPRTRSLRADWIRRSAEAS